MGTIRSVFDPQRCWNGIQICQSASKLTTEPAPRGYYGLLLDPLTGTVTPP